ncbi:M57 family metalloprotease [Aquimarina rhabdastrellae]
MKKIKALALSALVAGFVVSCQQDDVNNQEVTNATVELSKKHQLAVQAAGVNPNGAKYVTMQHLDGASFDAIQSGDIILALDKLAEQALASDGDTKQYHTHNLVSQGRTIDVVGFTGGRNALTQRMRTGLQWAVNNYNRISTSLTFRLTFEASEDADMVVYNAGGTRAGGVAEFPSNGRPGKYIAIYGGMDNFSNNVNEHVMTHEMGHALGLRHTDYARRVCEDGGNETAGIDGAIHIPGTPSVNQWGAPGLDTDSIMISCFNSQVDGEFSEYDVVALEYLY